MITAFKNMSVAAANKRGINDFLCSTVGRTRSYGLKHGDFGVRLWGAAHVLLEGQLGWGNRGEQGVQGNHFSSSPAPLVPLPCAGRLQLGKELFVFSSARLFAFSLLVFLSLLQQSWQTQLQQAWK